jgi:hypothetical protein
MGSAASAAAGEAPGVDLRLPVTGLKFNINQLRGLNAYVDSLYDDDQKGLCLDNIKIRVWIAKDVSKLWWQIVR